MTILHITPVSPICSENLIVEHWAVLRLSERQQLLAMLPAGPIEIGCKRCGTSLLMPKPEDVPIESLRCRCTDLEGYLIEYVGPFYVEE